MEIREIADYPNYQITSNGEIISKDRIVAGANGSERFIKGTNKKIQYNKEGNPIVQLSKDGEKKSFTLATLMAETFLGYDHKTQQICYRNGKSNDVRLENLVVVDAKCTIKVSSEHYDLLTKVLEERK